ncbi:hypothetical protein PTTG_00729 [Puccinia triticina 1-1 BBBD Race 1]|uniref:Uncharacterized protein n=1 Tax=Puccinia triticina (isolate 1-1 / race 1 (BBBD)) TaxID=630390 RepID=A0A180H113_PUCT1|nr:hypothetical protein PTTG_00729 [Puccinia triticina 1-1 BBBD Race 1]
MNWLWRTTQDVVCDPAFYGDQGRPLFFSTEEQEFILAVLELEPTLYLDEIQSHLEIMTGERHPISTISDELRDRLNMTKKVARTVHPAQCPEKRAW